MFDYLRELNLISLLFRLCLAAIFGGVIGFEREKRGRAAGFRTYMLTCVGATLALIIGQYEVVMANGLWEEAFTQWGIGYDITRLGAQVVSGIGFLGAGTILIIGNQEILGLTTAAGLWSSACIGIAIGAGFYECVIPCLFLMLLCFWLFPFVSDVVTRRTKYTNLKLVINSLYNVNNVVNKMKDMGISVLRVNLNSGDDVGTTWVDAAVYVKLPAKSEIASIMNKLSAIEEVIVVREIR